MSLGNILSVTDISASGMAAERLRMEVVANNIANHQSTRTLEGGPFRRQQVLFSTAFDNASGFGFPNADQMHGVQVLGIEADASELPRIYQPGHPDSDADGFVTMPNVQLPNEMVDLITASRSYEANLKVLRTFREMTEQALALLRAIA